MGLFTDLFLYGLVVPILPYILTDRVHLPQSQVQSHVSGLLAAYAGASVLLSPVAGYIADRTSSRQLPFLTGLSALIAATALFFTGTSNAVLTVARVAQGASSAFVWTVGLSLCLDTVGVKNLGKTIGSIFSFISVGELFAPVVGGVLYDKAGIGAVAAVAVSILAVDFFMRLLVIEKKVAARYAASPPSRETDESESTSDSDTDADAATDAPLHDESTPLIGATPPDDPYLIPSPSKQPALIRRMPILYCLRSPSLLTALLVALIQALLLAAFDATIPTHAAALYRFDSLRAGALFAPLGLANLLLGPLAGWAVDRYGTKPVGALGYAYLVPALALLRIPTAAPYPQQAILYGALLALSGCGLAVIGAPSIVEAGAVVERFHRRNPEFFGSEGPYAQLYGINSMVFSLGLAIGPVLAGGLTDRIGYGDMSAVLAGISGVTAVLCFVWLGGLPSMFRRKNS